MRALCLTTDAGAIRVCSFPSICYMYESVRCLFVVLCLIRWDASELSVRDGADRRLSLGGQMGKGTPRGV